MERAGGEGEGNVGQQLLLPIPVGDLLKLDHAQIPHSNGAVVTQQRWGFNAALKASATVSAFTRILLTIWLAARDTGTYKDERHEVNLPKL